MVVALGALLLTVEVVAAAVFEDSVEVAVSLLHQEEYSDCVSYA